MFAVILFGLCGPSRLFGRVACDLAGPTLALFGFQPAQRTYRPTRLATIAVLFLTMYVSAARGLIALIG
jgi:hypothetical protein